MNQQYQDQVLVCRDCGNNFVWTSSEQQFYAEKGFANAPVRCPDCRARKKAAVGGGRFGPRQMFDATCSNCGRPCQVPFQPRLDESGKPVKPIYCNDCFRQLKTGQPAPAESPTSGAEEVKPTEEVKEAPEA